MPSIPAPALYNACAAGNAAVVRKLLPAGGTRLNLSGPRFQSADDQVTPLMVAVQSGHADIVRMLLERAPNTAVGYMNPPGVTALCLAALYHHADVVQLLTDCGGNVNVATRPLLITPLRAAVGRTNPTAGGRNPDPDGARQFATVMALLRLGANLDPVDGYGMTPLCLACNLGNTEVAVVFLDARANIDFVTPPRHEYAGLTPLMYAAMESRTGVAKLLLKRGADGTVNTTHAAHGHDVESTAFDIARRRADRYTDCAETFVVLRKRCCSACGMTSPGLAAKPAGEQRHLKRCSNCPARGSRARYCNEDCQRADWVSRHRGECAGRGWVRQAAGTT